MNANQQAVYQSFRARAWLVLCCLCLVSVTVAGPVNATLMSMSQQAKQLDMPAEQQLPGDEAMPMVHHDSEGAASCDDATCLQGPGCSGGCLHCSICSVSIAMTTSITPIEHLGVGTELIGPAAGISLPRNRLYPPFRPPITIQ